ncbi:MAG: hypothetical protein WD844_13635 [Thermoleophilaceae bacterium]
MRRTVLTVCTLAAAAFPAPALADHPPAPDTHGADPAAIDRGPDLRPGARARAASGSTTLPTNWCGEEVGGDEARNELPNGDFRYHAVYAIPADAPSRLQQMSGQIQTDAMRATGLVEQLYGRAIRYDMGTACGAQFIDITVVRLAETTAQLQGLANSATGTLDAVSRALDSNGFGVIKSGDSFATAQSRNRNWIVWLDGPGPSGACGQAMLYDDDRRSEENYNNLGGKVAVVFRDDESSFCGANSVRHEIAHNLGAVVSGAPHSSGGHCTDAIEDTMCLPGSPQRAGGEYHSLWFDYGNDDYWDPPGGAPLPWWTVNLNRFVCPNASCNLPSGYSPPPPPPAEGGSGSGEQSSSTRRRARVQLKARRYARNRWSLSARVRGRGTGVVSVSCRTSRRARSTTVWSRRTRIPRTLRKRVRCASRPRVTAYHDAKTSASTARAAAKERWRTAQVRLSPRGSSSWRLTVRTRTRGQATVRVSCPRSRTRSRLVWSRSARAPRTLRASVRCSREPTVGVS